MREFPRAPSWPFLRNYISLWGISESLMALSTACKYYVYVAFPLCFRILYLTVYSDLHLVLIRHFRMFTAELWTIFPKWLRSELFLSLKEHSMCLCREPWGLLSFCHAYQTRPRASTPTPDTCVFQLPMFSITSM